MVVCCATQRHSRPPPPQPPLLPPYARAHQPTPLAHSALENLLEPKGLRSHGGHRGSGSRPPLAPPASRVVRAAAALVLLWGLTAVATVYGMMGAAWMVSAANAARIAARRLYGADSRAAAVAWDLLAGSLAAIAVLFLVGVALALVVFLVWLLPPWRCASRKGEALEVGGDEGAPKLVEQGRDPESRGARDRLVTKPICGSKGEAREIGGDGGVMMLAAQGRDQESRGACDRPIIKQKAPVLTVLIVIMVVGLLMVVFALAMGSCEQRVGSMLVDIGSFLISLWFCFVIPKDVIEMAADFAEMRKVFSELASLCMNPSRLQDSQFFLGQEISLGHRG